MGNIRPAILNLLELNYLIPVYMSNKVEHQICYYTPRKPKNNSPPGLCKRGGLAASQPNPSPPSQPAAPGLI